MNGTRTIRFGIGPINVPDRVAAGLLFLGPVVAALMLLVLGAIRNYRSDGSTENSNWPASSSCELICGDVPGTLGKTANRDYDLRAVGR